MNKRQKKKVGTRFHLLRQSKRQAEKRKGQKCIAYEIVEMGEGDHSSFMEDGGYGPDYQNATHWLVKVVHRNDVYFQKEHAPYQTLIYPCTSQGTSDSISPIHMMFHWRGQPEDMLPFFEQITEDMKNDRYRTADY